MPDFMPFLIQSHNDIKEASAAVAHLPAGTREGATFAARFNLSPSQFDLLRLPAGRASGGGDRSSAWSNYLRGLLDHGCFYSFSHAGHGTYFYVASKNILAGRPKPPDRAIQGRYISIVLYVESWVNGDGTTKVVQKTLGHAMHIQPESLTSLFMLFQRKRRLAKSCMRDLELATEENEYAGKLLHHRSKLVPGSYFEFNLKAGTCAETRHFRKTWLEDCTRMELARRLEVVDGTPRMDAYLHHKKDVLINMIHEADPERADPANDEDERCNMANPNCSIM